MQVDNICKLLADNLRYSFVAWRLGIPKDRVRQVDLANVELPATPLRADTAFLLLEQRVLLHVEFQTAFEPDLPFRMLSYYVRLFDRYKGECL